MKYLAIFDDNFLSNFRLDDNGLTLVMNDEAGYNRAVALKPIIRPVLTVTEDCIGATSTNSIYLTLGHMNALKNYEQMQILKEEVERMRKSLDILEENGE